MILWDWHKFKGNQSTDHSAALQSHWEHPNWGQQKCHPLFEPFVLPRVSWQGEVAAIMVGEGQAPLLLSACSPHWPQSYSGWKRPLSPTFDCSPPWGAVLKDTVLNEEMEAGCTFHTPLGHYSPMEAITSPLSISGICSSPSGSWWQQEVNTGYCLHGGQEHS